MEIYLVRHTKPLIGQNICYGQTDIPVSPVGFVESASAVLNLLPNKINALYSSPLIRCCLLAEFIQQKKYPSIEITFSDLLMELNFGEWENKRWNEINESHLNKWMNDFVNVQYRAGKVLFSFIKEHNNFLTIPVILVIRL